MYIVEPLIESCGEVFFLCAFERVGRCYHRDSEGFDNFPGLAEVFFGAGTGGSGDRYFLYIFRKWISGGHASGLYYLAADCPVELKRGRENESVAAE